MCTSRSCLLTRLKNKIDNNSTWEGAFYQSEWVKTNSCWVSLVFHFMCVAANASQLFCMTRLENSERFLWHSNLSFWISDFMCMKTRQLELTKINSSVSRCVFSPKWEKLTQDELFSIFKSKHFLRVWSTTLNPWSFNAYSS